MRTLDIVIALKTVAPTFYMYPIVDDHNPAPSLPFITYVPGTRYIYADNKNYSKELSLTLEYYFAIKDETKEEQLENKLRELGLTFSRSEDTSIEGMFVIYYYI